MRILCTGNPDKKTIAWAVREKWPHAQTISLSQGYDLRMQNEQDIQKFKEKILSCNIFINSSYINEQAQSTMLDLAVKEWIAKDINKLYIESWKLGIKSLYYQFSENSAQAFARNILDCVACEA